MFQRILSEIGLSLQCFSRKVQLHEDPRAVAAQVLDDLERDVQARLVGESEVSL